MKRGTRNVPSVTTFVMGISGLRMAETRGLSRSGRRFADVVRSSRSVDPHSVWSAMTGATRTARHALADLAPTLHGRREPFDRVRRRLPVTAPLGVTYWRRSDCTGSTRAALRAEMETAKIATPATTTIPVVKAMGSVDEMP